MSEDERREIVDSSWSGQLTEKSVPGIAKYISKNFVGKKCQISYENTNPDAQQSSEYTAVLQLVNVVDGSLYLLWNPLKGGPMIFNPQLQSTHSGEKIKVYLQIVGNEMIFSQRDFVPPHHTAPNQPIPFQASTRIKIL